MRSRENEAIIGEVLVTGNFIVLICVVYVLNFFNRRVKKSYGNGPLFSNLLYFYYIRFCFVALNWISSIYFFKVGGVCVTGKVIYLEKIK